jgi:hypothetical protein
MILLESLSINEHKIKFFPFKLYIIMNKKGEE